MRSLSCLLLTSSKTFKKKKPIMPPANNPTTPKMIYPNIPRTIARQILHKTYSTGSTTLLTR